MLAKLKRKGNMLAKLKFILGAVTADLVDTYKRCKILIFAILAAIFYLEFNKIKEALLVYMGQKELKSDQKQDQTLSTQEVTEDKQADALVQDAKQLPSEEPKVDDNWYKGDGK